MADEARSAGSLSAEAGVDPETAEKDLHKLRHAHPKLVIQMVSMKKPPGEWAVRMMAAQTLRAMKTGALLASKAELDLLLRVAGTRQITDALKNCGYKADGNKLLIAAGSPADVMRLRKTLSAMRRYKVREGEALPDEDGMRRVEAAALLGTRT